MQNPETVTLLHKLRKNSSGFLNVKKLHAVLAELPNWTITKTLKSTHSSYFGSYNDTNAYFIPESSTLSVDVTSNFRDPMEGLVTIHINDQAANARDELQQAFTRIQSWSITPKHKKFHVESLSSISDDKFTFRYMYSSRGFIITSPATVVFLFGDTHQANSPMNEFIRWAHRDTTFMVDINTVLGTDDNDATAKPERTDENTGICPVCFTTYKLRNDHLVLHGYTQTGHGFISGACKGVDYLAYELSNTGTKHYLTHIATTLITKREMLVNIGSTIELMIRVNDEMITIKKGDLRFDVALATNKRNLLGEINQLESLIDSYEKKISEWTLSSLT